MSHLLLQLLALVAVTVQASLLVPLVDKALRKRMASRFLRQCAFIGILGLYLITVLVIFA